MYGVTVKVEAKSTDDKDDFDMEATVVYRNIKSVDAVDRVTAGVVSGLFSLGNVKVQVVS